MYNEKAGFDLSVELTKPSLEHFLIFYFGEKCKDFERDCECCKRWAAFDILMKNPFTD